MEVTSLRLAGLTFSGHNPESIYVSISMVVRPSYTVSSRSRFPKLKTKIQATRQDASKAARSQMLTVEDPDAIFNNDMPGEVEVTKYNDLANDEAQHEHELEVA